MKDRLAIAANARSVSALQIFRMIATAILVIILIVYAFGLLKGCVFGARVP